ncbi:MAG: hypothetical protein FWF15_00105 [Oscillospiraceae bacterium]|nr:hypothetical protein [Oscillospiraceae bacterium]
MNDNNTSAGGMGVASVPLAENAHVKELLGILSGNGKDTSGLNALISHVSDMENFVKMAESKISDMKSQLDAMKEVQNHPIKTALQNTIKVLEAKVAEIKIQLSELKHNIVEGCKNAVLAFKETGASVLDKLASFFHIKDNLQSMSKEINAGVRQCDKAVAKIETFSKEYHKTGRNLKNMGRILIGKEPINAVKEFGKLAKVFSAPYKAHKVILVKIKKSLNKMAAKLETFEQTTAVKREERATAKAEKKPSLAEKLKANKELIKQKDLETPKSERVKTPGIEV